MTLQGHFSTVTSLSFTPDGWTLLSAGRDKVAMLWDIRTHAMLATIPLYQAVEGTALGLYTVWLSYQKS